MPPERPLPCFACGAPLQPAFSKLESSAAQPCDAVMFYAYGQYGSTVFDPQDDSQLQINICDACLLNNRHRVWHARYVRQPAQEIFSEPWSPGMANENDPPANRCASVVQLAETPPSKGGGCGFESRARYFMPAPGWSGPSPVRMVSGFEARRWLKEVGDDGHRALLVEAASRGPLQGDQMSHTDKDMPDWVCAQWWEPYHTCTRHHGRHWLTRTPTCELPDEPVIEWEQPWRARRGCHWIPVQDRRRGYGHNYRGGHPPKWFVDHVWNNHVRTRVRDQLRQAIAEYRAGGAVSVVPDVDQHRHGAYWLWD